MLKNVRNTIAQYNMIKKGNSVIVALSGGADSIALLFSLYLLKDELGFSLSACHVNHNLRGVDSDNDQQYCVDFCKKLNIPLTIKSIDIKALQKKHESVEECARNARYDFFAEIGEGKLIATAHTASDNAETVLLNLTRGSALKGICGIPPIRDNIIRPLLYCTRADIEEFCQVNNLSFCTDKTNFSLSYTRNKLRHITIPQLTEINPALLATIGRMTVALNQDSAYLEKIAFEIKKNAENNKCFYDINALSALDDCILNRIIAQILTESHVTPSNLRITEIAQIIRAKSGKINIAQYKFAVAKKGLFYVETNLEKFRKNSHKI